MTLVDTNVLIDLIARDALWLEPSRDAFARRMALGEMGIVDIVFAETSLAFASVDDCKAFLAALGVVGCKMADEALFLAGRAFKLYRSRGGAKTSVLPDFFIGAQAQVMGCALLTRDARRYRAYFPQVEVVGP